MKYSIEPNGTDRATLVAEQVTVPFTSKRRKTVTIPSCTLVSRYLPSKSLNDNTFEVEAMVAGSKDDEKKLIGPRLVRRLGGIPGALARRELHMPELAKPEGYKLILIFLEKKGYKKDALDRRLVANRRFEAISRRPGQTRCSISLRQKTWPMQMQRKQRQACIAHVIKSGLTDDQINHSTVSCTNPMRKDHEKLWILERFKKLHSDFTTNLGMWTDTVTPERLWADIHDL